MNNWQIKKLGEVCEIKPQKKEARDRLNDNDLVSFVPMEDLGILTKDFTAIKERQLQDVCGSYTYFSDNDVLLAKITPCFENGKIGIARNLKNGIGFGSSEYIVFRPNKDLLSEYLFYFLSDDNFRQEGKKSMIGAVGHKRVSKEFVENYQIPFPSIPEQKRIVAILDKTFAVITKAKENAEKNLQNARELFESYLQNIFANPGDSWEEKSIGEIADIEYGFTDKANDTGDYRYIRITDIDKSGNLAKHNKVFINSSEEAKKFVLKDGDLLMARTGATYAKVLLYENLEKSVFASYLIRINFKRDIVNKLYWYFSKSRIYWEQANKLSSGAAQPQFNGGALKQLVFYFPKSLEEQKHIAAKLDALSTEVKKLETIYQQKLADLEELRKSVLHKAFNGELGEVRS
jgi:type I restriction enzyme S subunit